MMTPTTLRTVLETRFPRNAVGWNQATDEVREIARSARLTLELGEEYAVNFRRCTTPAQWNCNAIDAAVEFYSQMTSIQRAAFISRITL